MINGTAVVTDVERISPTFARIELGGEDLADFGVDGPTYDQRIKLLFGSGQDRVMRTYTVREVRCGPRVVVDFALHLDPDCCGPATRWAAAAAPGALVGIIAPRRGEVFGGIEWSPGSAGRLLIAGDETAVPAISAILEQLPAQAGGSAYLEVPDAEDIQDVRAPAGFEVSWLVRGGSPQGALLEPAVRSCALLPHGVGEDQAAAATDDPDLLWETPAYSSSGEQVADAPDPLAGTDLYAWIAGEAGVVTGLRRYLVQELGMPRRQVAFMGYWRRGRPGG